MEKETQRSGVYRLVMALWKRLFEFARSSRLEIKLSFIISGFTIVLLLLLWCISSVSAYIQPGDQVTRSLSFNTTPSYCVYWATNHEQIGKPTPGPCGVMLVGVNLSPSDSMPPTPDEYAFGNCTYWAAFRRGQIGKPIPNTWGDAYLWAGRAASDGYAVDHTPAVGAIMQSSAGGLGHVAFVESVDGDGTWHISEMNVIGLNQVDYRTMSPASAAYYAFIH